MLRPAKLIIFATANQHLKLKIIKQKVVWITGASSGIGRALAEKLAKEDCKLILSSRNINENNLDLKVFGGENNCMILPFDLSNTNQFNSIVEKAFNRFGKIDILVNNAGISQRSYAMETSEEIERNIFEIDYFAQVKLAKMVFAKMQNAGNLKIVVISSIAGIFGFYYRSTYSAAKHALKGYFESMRFEYERQGLSVLLVYPGKIKTNISINAIGKDGAKHNIMDESHVNAMTAEECALKIIHAIKTGKKELFVGKKEMIMVFLYKYFGVLFFFLARRVNKN